MNDGSVRNLAQPWKKKVTSICLSTEKEQEGIEFALLFLYIAMREASKPISIFSSD